MTSLSRVVWTEGMHLAQHHFQAQSRYVEEAAAFAISSLYFKPYGLVRCVLDEDAIRNGTVAIHQAHGIMPDGLAFRFPEDPVPGPVQVRAHFPTGANDRLVFLSIPSYREGGANCGPDPQVARSTRFVSVAKDLPDETTGGDLREIEVARKNFTLDLSEQPAEGTVRLPLARIRRDGAGGFEFDPDFIPPCVQIGASARLLDVLTRLVEVMDQKATAMARERAASRSSLSDFASREVAGFWFAHVLHSALPSLRHALDSQTIHPEHLYGELARLGGALCTFGMDAHPNMLPAYDHDSLGDCFLALDAQIRTLLELVIPTNCVQIPLQPFDPFGAEGGAAPQAEIGFLAGTVTDDRCFGSSQWYLGVRSSAAGLDLAARVPVAVKLCSAQEIHKLVTRSLEGPVLTHVPAPPPAISPRMDTEYFRIAKQGPAWERIALLKTVGVHVPDVIPDAHVELSVVLD